MYLDATYRVTTPLFLGGASPEEIAELRPSTLKGLLRFWFRAIALPKLKDCKEVKNLEDDIFGSTKKQSSFLLTIHQQKELTEKKTADNWRNRHGLLYLGRGVVEEKRMPRGKRTEIQIRPYFEARGNFTVRLRTKKNISEEAFYYLPLVLQALGLFGAAGARARKGFGSLSLESLLCNGKEIWEKPTTVKDLINRQKMLFQKIKLDKADDTFPKYTAFSNHSRVWIVRTSADALELLNDLGFEMLRYRSYGRKNKDGHTLPGGSIAEQNFVADHDLMLNFCNGKEINTHPHRVAFGLPHNYYFGSTRNNVDISPANKDYNRRASPLFIHIHALEPNSYAAVLTLLPSIFLPDNEKIKITASRQTVNRVKEIINTAVVDSNVDYRYIEDFINRPAFSQSKEVAWP